MLKKSHLHFLGIGGSGASAIAALAKATGFKITGCDINPANEFTKHFSQNELFRGHNPSHLNLVDILIISPAVTASDPNNAEVFAAKKKGIPILTWQEFMGKYLEENKYVIAICGTHGKSTTTAMVGTLLEDAGLDPTVELGAIVPRWRSNYRIGRSSYFVTEADEFNDNFLFTQPNVSIITSVEMDHPEYFKDFEDYKNSFYKFLSQTKKAIIANLNDQAVASVLKDVMKKTQITAFNYSKQDLQLKLNVPGQYNQSNASAVFQLGLLLGIDTDIIRKSLENFTGIGRRFEEIGKINNALIYSDFAHHPTELKKTLFAARDKFSNKDLIVVFQPHMFSRTKALWQEFKISLKNIPAKKIYLLDIYRAREQPIPSVTSQKLAEEINDIRVEYTKEASLLKIAKNFNENNIVFFVGAGSVDNLARNLVKELN